MFISKFELATINARLTKLETEADGARRELHLQFSSFGDPCLHWVPLKKIIKLILGHLKMRPMHIEATEENCKLIKDKPIFNPPA